MIQAAVGRGNEDKPEIKPWRNGPIKTSRGEQEEEVSGAAKAGGKQAKGRGVSYDDTAPV